MTMGNVSYLVEIIIGVSPDRPPRYHGPFDLKLPFCLCGGALRLFDAIYRGGGKKETQNNQGPEAYPWEVVLLVEA